MSAVSDLFDDPEIDPEEDENDRLGLGFKSDSRFDGERARSRYHRNNFHRPNRGENK